MYGLVIADDEEVVRLGLRKNIKWAKYGFKLLDDASNGRMALDMIMMYGPDLLITDIKMPDIDGIELLIQAKRIDPKIQVIILSAYDCFQYAQAALAYDAAGYLLKPIEEQQLDDIMYKIQKNIGKLNHHDKSPKNKRNVLNDDIIERSRKYIQENYRTKLTLDKIAGICYTNPTYLSTVFKEKMGCGFVDYVFPYPNQKSKGTASCFRIQGTGNC